ncbi:MAG: regulatory protein RecX [Patescibacteria group bacterium]
MIDEELEMAKRQTLHFLSFRLRSVEEVRKFLFKKNHPPELIQKAIDELSQHKFLDDQAFAGWWAESRINQGWGEMKIKNELKMKGVGVEIINSVIARDWGEIIKKELKDKDKSLKTKQWLAGRGFTFSQITLAFDDFTING